MSTRQIKPFNAIIFGGDGDLSKRKIIPAFFNNDANGILERSRMTKNGQLTPAFSYLQAFVDGTE